MKRISFFNKLCIVLLALMMAGMVSAAPDKNLERRKFAPDYDRLKSFSARDGQVRVIARVKKNILLTDKKAQMLAGRQQLMSAMRKKNITALKELTDLPFVVYEVNQQQLDELLDSGWIEQVVEDRANRPHLNTSKKYIGAGAAQSLGYEGDGATVAILDTGFQTTHSHFTGRIVEEACYSSSSGRWYTSLCPGGVDGSGVGTAGACTDGDCYHGTHVSSIAAGQHNSYGGIAPKANIIMVQVFTRVTRASTCAPAASPCLLAYDSDILAGMAYVESLAGSYNISTVNLSLGGGQYTSACTGSSFQNMTDEVNVLKALGIATIASSGNDGYTNAMGYPACIPEVISVGSVKDTGNTVSDFSNSADFLDFMAPGEPIDGAIPTWIFSNGLARLSGTSMSAPHVSGAFTVLKAIDSSLTVDEMKALLIQQSANFTDPRNGLSFPSIRLNTDNDGDGLIFLQELDLGTDPEDAAPVVTIESPTTGLSQLQSTMVNLVGSAADTEDGNLSSSVVWASSIDGDLGQGADFDVALSVGVHTITAAVADSMGANPVTIPFIEITIIADGDSDGMDDNWEALHGVSDPSADPDGDGLTNLEEYDAGIDPTDASPIATILSPQSGVTLLESAMVNFIGSATDTEDGDISSAIQWSSNLDGSVGTGTPNSVALTAGTHTITLTVMDSKNAAPVSPPSIQVEVLADSDDDGMADNWEALYGVSDPAADFDGDGLANLDEYTGGSDPTDAAPVATITSPQNNTVFLDSATVSFVGSATDAEDGDISSAIQWSSNIDGSVGTGTPISVPLTAGTHTITLTVMDSKNGVPVSLPSTQVEVLADSDDDGMADDWEAFHGVSDPSADSDGDGVSNLQEYTDGSDPQDHTIYFGAPEFCGDGVDQNLDGDEIGYEDPADPLSNVVCEQEGGLVKYYVYDYSYDSAGQVLFTIDGLGNVTEIRYLHDSVNQGEVTSRHIYHDNIFTELTAWQNNIQTLAATSNASLESAPSASDIHDFLIDRNRSEGRLHAQLLANGFADYPLDDDQWDGLGHWAMAHESDNRRLMGMIIGAANTPTLNQRFSLAEFSELINGDNLQLQLKGSDYSYAGHVQMQSRWMVWFYNEQGQTVGAPLRNFIMDNTWQDREFFVDVPATAVEVQIKLQVVLAAVPKGGTRDPIYSDDVPVYFDHIRIAAVEKNRRSTIAEEADRYSYTLYDYSSASAIETTTYFAFDSNGREHYQIDGQGLVRETLYDTQAQVSERIDYSDSVQTLLAQWVIDNPNQQAPETADIALWLGDDPVVSNHVKYHSGLTATIGLQRTIAFSEIIEVLAGTGLSIDSIVNVVDGQVEIVGETIIFTPAGNTGNERFEVILTGGVETLRIGLDFQ